MLPKRVSGGGSALNRWGGAGARAARWTRPAAAALAPVHWCTALTRSSGVAACRRATNPAWGVGVLTRRCMATAVQPEEVAATAAARAAVHVVGGIAVFVALDRGMAAALQGWARPPARRLVQRRGIRRSRRKPSARRLNQTSTEHVDRARPPGGQDEHAHCAYAWHYVVMRPHSAPCGRPRRRGGEGAKR
jgi:hypothetical protein